MSLLACALTACAVEASAPDEIRQPILGGQVESGHPAVGLLEFSTGNFGTGTLIAPNVVLTAAHVVRGNIQGFFLGQGMPIGRGPNTASSDTMTKYELAEKIVHPSYECDALGKDAGADCAEWGDIAYDVGLVFLTEPVAGVAPVRFGTAAPNKDDVCLAVGFGDFVADWDAADAAPTVKQKRSAESAVRNVRETEFETRWISGIPDSGDSGGPLFCNDTSGQRSLLGTTAYHRDGEGPAHQREWFMRTDWAMGWIEREIVARGGSWPPPANLDAPSDAGAGEEAGVDAGAATATPNVPEEEGGCQASSQRSAWLALVALALVAGRRSRRRAEESP